MKKHAAIEGNEYYLSVERIVTLCPLMTDEERSALHAWEKTNVTGDAHAASSDWPGWKAVVDRLSH